MTSETRRLAAVVAADVAGYSSLVSADEEGVLRDLRRLRAELIDPAIAAHGGRIANTAGDSLLAEFPSAVNAMRCCLDMQQGVAAAETGIAFRVGLHVGDVVVEGDDLMGQGVNIAARLEGLGEPGGVLLSDDAYRQVRGRVDAAFEDLGEQRLKNISEPVQVWRLSGVAARRQTAAKPDHPSIAVLPFQNMSADPAQDFLADGLAEDIITYLSKIPGFLVVARNSTFAYKGQAVDVRKVGAEQGVRHVLEGSLQKAGDRVRITAQLIDAETGHHVWAERYDRVMDDIFALQDEITLAVATELQAELSDGDMARLRGAGTRDVRAWTEQVRAANACRTVRPESYAKARAHAMQAIAIDPDYAAPWSTLTFVAATEARHGFSESREDSIEEARRFGEKALALDPENIDARASLGFAEVIVGRHEEGVAMMRAAARDNPNHAELQARLSIALAFAGYADEAVRAAEAALRLSPRAPGWFDGCHGHALRLAGRLDEAEAAFRAYGRKAAGFGLVDLALVEAARGDADAARRHAQDLLRHRPDFTVSRWAFTQHHADKAVLAAEMAALRAAGLPE